MTQEIVASASVAPNATASKEEEEEMYGNGRKMCGIQCSARREGQREDQSELTKEVVCRRR